MSNTPSIVRKEVNTGSNMQCSAKMLLLVSGVITAVFVVIFVATYFSARSGTVVEMGEGDDMSLVKESSGLHILEVDNTGQVPVRGGPALR